MRDASQNSTSARVASASARTVPLELSRSMPSKTSGPTSNPTATKTIAGVTGVPDSRLEIAATPSSVSATMASDHSIQRPRGLEIAPPSVKALHAISMIDLRRAEGDCCSTGPRWPTANA